MRKGVAGLSRMVNEILPVGAAKPAIKGPALEFCMCRMNGAMLQPSIQYLEFDASNALDCDLELAYIQKGCIDVAFKVKAREQSDYPRIHAGFHEGAFDALVAKHEIFRINFINWPIAASPQDDELAFELQD